MIGQTGKGLNRDRTFSCTRLWAIALGLVVSSSLSFGIVIGESNPAHATDADATDLNDLNAQLIVRLNNGTYGSARNKADALLRVGKSQELNGRLQESVQSWQQALVIYQTIGDREAEALTYYYLASAYAELGEPAAFEDATRRWLAVARDRQDFQTQIYALNSLGQHLSLRGGTEGANELFTEAVAVSDSIKSLEGQAISHDSLGTLAYSTGNYDRAAQEYEQALLASRKAADSVAQAKILNNLGNVYQVTGRYADSMKYYALAFRLADLNKDRANQYRAIDGMVAAYNATGSYQESFKLLGDRLKMAQIQKNMRQELASLQALAQLYRQVGDYPNAKVSYERAIVMARALQDSDQENRLIERLVSLMRDGSDN